MPLVWGRRNVSLPRGSYYSALYRGYASLLGLFRKWNHILYQLGLFGNQFWCWKWWGSAICWTQCLLTLARYAKIARSVHSSGNLLTLVVAVQSVGVEEEGGYIAYWSESHVSEDFDIALRLQIAGNIVRVATYHNYGFKEGVSLTIYDEISRWEK